MATTQNGIYYPTDGTQPADVLADMKKMAESMEEAIINNKFNPKEINDNITKIQEEQTTQNKAIEANTTAIEENTRSIKQNTTDITKLQEENAMLKEQIPQGTASGEEVNLQDSAEMPLVDFSLQGNSKQNTREGYNLANYNTKITGKYNFNFEIGDITSGKAYTLYLYIPLGTLSFNLRYNTSGGNNILTDYNKTGKIVKTFTANQDGILYFNGFGESSDYNGIEQIMLLEGTYTTENIPAFEEYGKMPSLDYPAEVEAVGDSGSVEIVKSNKNILDFGDEGNSKIKYENNKVTIKNPTTYLYNTKCNLFSNNFLNKKTLTFTFIAEGEVTGDNYVNLVFFTNKRSYLVEKIYNKGTYANSKFTKTVTLQDGERFNQCLVYTAGTTCDLTIDVQVEIADEATDFVEHKENTYTLPIQKPMLNGDYIDLDSKKEVHTYTKKVVSNTTEFDVNKNSNDGTFQISIAVTSPVQNEKIICNMFKFKPNIWNETGCQISGNTFYGIIKFGDSGFTEDLTKDQAKQKFAEIIAETNLVFYYKTTTPEELDLTEEQAQVLEQIIEDGTYKEVTHYFTEDEVKPTLEVKYYKDLETLFKNQEQMQATLDNVQAQLLDLGGNLDE